MNDVDRRSLLRAGLGAAGSAALAACGHEAAHADATGAERRITLTAAPAVVDLGAGVTAPTWAYEGRTPARELRITAGEAIVADLVNELPAGTGTSLHWHGLALPNAVDGAPPVTQRAVAPGETFRYRFTAPDPGTYFVHPHVGVQLDRGMQAPLIVEDPHEPLSYDDEWVVVVDDWLDGVTGTPDSVLAELTGGMDGMGGAHGTSGTADGHGEPSAHGLDAAPSRLLGGRGGHLRYPYHLVNGRVPADPEVRTGTPGHRVRLRIVNAGSDTAYRIALGGHRMTVTHTDGYPVEHRTADALLVGMGERYDVLVRLGDGVFPLVALAEGKDAAGLALIRTGAGAAPPATVRPAELDGEVVTASRLRASQEVRLRPGKPDRTHVIRVSGSMSRFDWAINGIRFDMDDPRAHPYWVRSGERVRLEFVNASGMFHPMHLHGHTFQCGTTGPRKDTVMVLPGERVTVHFDAVNPGDWMMHCHNVYHGETGMMALLSYQD